MTSQRTRLLTLAAALIVAGCSNSTTKPMMTTAAQPPLATRPTVGQEVGAVAQNQLEIVFAAGSARLSSDADGKLDIAARLFRDVRPAVMFAIGHSDAEGDEYRNLLLSAERARAVKQALLARGIPPDRLYIQAVGESDPVNRRDPTAPENRRVVVKWQVL